MSSLRKAKLAINTICNLGSKILTRSCRNPVCKAEHQLKQQCVSVNSPSTTNTWRVSWHSKFTSFHAFGKQTHQGAHQNFIPLSPRNRLIRFLVIGGVVITVWGLERIPYSKIFHLILVSIDLEREIGERRFNDLMKTYEGKILPETHPESKVRSGLGYNNQVQDDMRRVKKSREKGFRVATYHLEGLNWEILVVDKPEVNALCIPGGKIVVFTGLLDAFRTDAERATIIAQEVGHLVVRHKAEFSHIFFLLHVNEMEADYIGLLLLASAGYDPRMAPQVYEKLGEFSGESPLDDDSLATHPSGIKRAEVLSRDKVMGEALSIYKESRSGILLEMLRMWVI
ncbi:hypothetical protein MKW98_023655 [Papaver atlanticum]|uniref:Peptidase M48 domain-containing protein n=1 Tax=Papaver atlanticum TaxID=357466 RepID=A0AAD4XMI4_9MAGN|nr:hypothetical protein MKW98_023655 [Papaver atlanticum]